MWNRWELREAAVPNRKKSLWRIEEQFCLDFQYLYRGLMRDLAAKGLAVGALVRNRTDGRLYRVTVLAPYVYNFTDEPVASVSVYGNRWRIDGTWGTHKHWCGPIRNLVIAAPERTRAS